MERRALAGPERGAALRDDRDVAARRMRERRRRRHDFVHMDDGGVRVRCDVANRRRLHPLHGAAKHEPGCRPGHKYSFARVCRRPYHQRGSTIAQRNRSVNPLAGVANGLAQLILAEIPLARRGQIPNDVARRIESMFVVAATYWTVLVAELLRDKCIYNVAPPSV